MAEREHSAAQSAVDALVHRLATDPQDRDAYVGLHAHYSAEDDYLSLVNLLAAWAAACTDPAAAAQAYREAAQLAESELDEPTRAEGYYRLAVMHDPRNAAAFERLHALLERAGRLGELTELLEALLEQLERDRAKPQLIGQVHYRLGELFGKQFVKIEVALSHYRRAFEADPKLVRAIYEARLITLQRGDVRGAGILYEREASAETDPTRKVALLRELADHYRGLLDHDGAISALERARGHAPSDVALTHALASELLQRSAAVDERVRALDLDRVGDLLCDIAQSVGPAEGRVFLASALGHAPWHHRALFELERSTPPEEQDSLALHWVSYLTHNPDGASADERRITLALAYRRAGQLQDAMFALVPAAEHGSARARELLDELRMQTAGDELTASEPQRSAAPPRVRPLSEAAAAHAKSVGPGASAVDELSSFSLIEAASAPLPAIDRGGEASSPALEVSSQLIELVAEAEVATAGDPAQALTAEQFADATSPGVHDAIMSHAAETELETDRGSNGRSSADDVGTSPGVAPALPLWASNGEPAARASEARSNGGEPSGPALPASEPAEPAPDPEEVARYRAELAVLVRSGKGDSGFELAEQILRAEPGDAEAFAVAERHYRRERDFRSRAELLLRSASTAELGRELRIHRLREAVTLFEGRLADPARALEAYRRLLEHSPEKDEIQRSLLRLLERSKRWDELIAELEQALGGQREPSQKIATWRRMAEVQRRERKDPAGAARALTQLLELDPDDRPARAALTDELIGLARWEEAVALIDRRIRDSASKAEQIPLLRQLGELFEHKLRDGEAAFHVYERLLELVPNDPAALERMEAIDDQSGSHERLLSTLERRLASATPLQAANLLVRMAALAETELLDPERATEYLRRALAHAPNNAQILTALANLLERSGRYAELLGLLRERAASERQAKARAELYRRIARLLADQLSERAAAAEAFAKVNEAGDDLEAWMFLASRARDESDHSGLAQALARLAPLETEPSLRRGLLFERASLLPTLGRASEAVDPLVQILIEIDPDDRPARTALGQLCESLSDYRGLARVLEAQLQRAPDAQAQAGVARELTALYTSKLPDEARAVRALGLWTKSAPEEPEPLRQLAAHYERKRKYKELLDALDALSHVESSDASRASALERAALIAHSRLRDDQGAFSRLAQYTERSTIPLSAGLLDLARRLERVAELCDLCERVQRYDEFFALLRERIGASREPPVKLELYRRLATALIEHRADDDGALAAYEGLLALGDDPEALRFVQSWAMRHDDPERLAATLTRLARSEGSPDEKRDLLYERGRLLLTRLARPDEAIAAFEEAAAVDPAFAPALDELASACEQAGDHARLAETLERQLVHADSGHDPLSLLRRLADLYEGPVNDERRASQTLQRWAELDLASPEPLRRLRRRLARPDQSSELLRTLDVLASRERDTPARIEALVAAANLAFDRFANADGAFQRLGPLLPEEHAEADATLIRIARAGDKLNELYERLESAGRHGLLVEQLELSASAEPDSSAAAALLRRAARTLHAELHDEDRAEAAYARLLARNEDSEALLFMQARALERDNPEALAAALLRLSKLERDPRALRDLLYDYAHLLNFRLRQPTAALPVLRRILFELDSEFEPALDELISAARAAGDDAVLAEALERRLIQEPESNARAELAQQLAELYEERLPDAKARTRALEIWSAEDSHNVVPRRLLAAALRERGDSPALLVCLDEIALLTDRFEERLEAERAAAQLCASALSDPDQAFERALRLARTKNPPPPSWSEDLLRSFAWQGGKLEELAQYYADGLRYDELVALLRERAKRERDTAAQATLLARAAHVLAVNVEDEDAAAEVYREVLELREDEGALRYLRAIAERNDDAAALEPLLRRLTALISERDRDRAPIERRELLLARARLLGLRLSAPSEAIVLLREILTEPEAKHAGAATTLVDIATRAGDDAALAVGLESKLELAAAPVERHALALRLANLYDGVLADPVHAAEALRKVCASDPDDLEAARRLRAHLERLHSPAELVAVLDVLSRIEDSQAARDAARLAAARALFRELGEAHAALARLAPLIHAAEPQAVHLADEVCRSELARELADVYETRAKQSNSLPLTRASWRKVAEIHELWLDDPAGAFDAYLLLLGTDPHNGGYLAEVDRLGKKTRAFERLEQIYAKLVRESTAPEERVALLVRLASILEQDASDARGALRQLMAAGRIAPHEPGLLARVERLASGLGAHSELLWAQEQRAKLASDPGVAIDAWLEVVRTADARLFDRERAGTALQRALELTPHAPDRLERLLPQAAAMDRARPELGKEDAQRSLLRALLGLAARGAISRGFAAELVLLAFRWWTEQLHDEVGGFDALRQGTSQPPIPDRLLETLEATAVRLGRLDALNAHLARVAERAEPAQRKLLLSRRARILEERLKRYDQAAQAYERLLELDPQDPNAEAHHFKCLKLAGRHRELLQALERRVQRAGDLGRRTHLMRQIAKIWEVDLKNRASAVVVWSELQALLPQDEEAQRAIARLQ